MEVILLERIARLGGMGDIVKVRDGYGRNYLIPNKKAMRASDESKAVFEERRHLIEEQNAKSKGAAEIEAEKLNGTIFTLMRESSQEGKLYGSVTIRDIADLLKEAGHEVQKSQIVMTSAIKTIGEYPVRINLHAEVTATINVSVTRSEHEDAA